jgi:hypothetical protein
VCAGVSGTAGDVRWERGLAAQVGEALVEGREVCCCVSHRRRKEAGRTWELRP